MAERLCVKNEEILKYPSLQSMATGCTRKFAAEQHAPKKLGLACTHFRGIGLI